MLKLKLGKKKGESAVPAVIDGETAQDVDAPEGGAKKKPPMLVIIIAAAVLVAAIGGGAAFFLMKPKGAEAEAEAAPEAAAKADAHGKEDAEGAAAPAAGSGTITAGPDGVTFYTLPDMIVNIQSPEGRTTYLKLKLTLEMKDAAVATQLQARYPRLNDMFQSFLRELRPEDLAGSAGSFQLRAEILRRVNLVASPGKVDAVLIEEMLVQ